jgi:hypothetical protein
MASRVSDADVRAIMSDQGVDEREARFMLSLLDNPGGDVLPPVGTPPPQTPESKPTWRSNFIGLANRLSKRS